ncbi:hypothetical protein HN588_10585 [Candidatus Bathyarchaeota archaeon]|jgi:hypothetical protein|nr:hypothetical protein [Candidatus Bathyarchaeota archaeon]
MRKLLPFVALFLVSCAAHQVVAVPALPDDCFEYVNQKILERPGCEEITTMMFNSAEDQAVVLCDIDADPVTWPEVALHVLMPGSLVESPGAFLIINEPPVCVSPELEVRTLSPGPLWPPVL